ncbi:hypothetical protein JCM3765_004325 [Sporobolomyces pararoseus]
MSTPQQPFLHLKFTSLRPVPRYGHQLPFAHLIDPSIHELPDSLKTDVQREGIKRYLVQNFKEGSFVSEVVKERLPGDEVEEGKDSDGMYLVVNRSWARTVGDNKLHLSLYVYQEDKHCATWHAYTDRTISYSRETEATPGDAPVETSEQEGDNDDLPNDEEEEEAEDDQIPNEDPYSPPSALAQYVATMESRPSSPFEPPERDSERPRFDRPYKEPVAESEEEEEEVKPAEKSKAKEADQEQRNRRSRSARKPKSESSEDQPPAEEARKKAEEEPVATERRSRSSRAARKPTIETDSESEKPIKPKVKESKDEQLEKKPSSNPIVKSQPIGHRSSRTEHKEDEAEESKSRSPSPIKTRSSRSKKREPSPESQIDSSRSPSHSPTPTSTRRKELSPSPSPAPSPIVESKQERGRRKTRPTQEASSISPSRSPSPPRQSRSSRSKLPPVNLSRSPSPPPVKSRSSQRERSKSPSRSPSPVRETRSSRSRSKPRPRVKEEEEERIVEKVKPKSKETSRSRSRSRSPSRSPPRRSHSRAQKTVDEERKHKSHKSHQQKTRDHSRSPSPEPTKGRYSQRERSPSPSPPPPPPPSSGKPRRRHSVSAPPPEALPRSTATPSTEPTWRSVSRNRHRRPDDSDEDTLVRGNMDDHELDIPAGGESTLLKAKPRKKRSNSTAAKDEAFDPDEVERARLERETEKVPQEPQTLKSAVGGWFKSVGTLIATEAKLAVGKVEEEVVKTEAAVEEWEEKELEEKRKRKEERARRREERAKRKEKEEKEKRKKERELERMVDRAEDAAEDMMENSERMVARKEKEAKRKDKEKKKSRAAGNEDSQEESEEEVETRSRRSRHNHTEQATSIRSHSKHRVSRPVSPELDEEIPTYHSHRHRQEEASKSESRQHQSRHIESASPSASDHEDDKQPAPRPALRQRAMSISASVDAGIKGLRDSVSKIVSDARQVESSHKSAEDDGERHRDERRELRKIEAERQAIEQERKQIEQDAERERKERRALEKLERDTDERRRLAERPGQPRRKKEELGQENTKSSTRERQSSRPPLSPSDLPEQDSEISHLESEAEAPPAHSRRSTRRTKIPSDDESEASIPPMTRSRQRNNVPPSSRYDSVTSDTDMSDAPSRSSRSVRSMDRSESEADTPAHLEAKRNARRNSTTVPIETIRSLREQQLNAGTRSIPSSPVSTRSRQDLPARSERLEQDIRHRQTGVSNSTRKEKGPFEDESTEHHESNRRQNIKQRGGDRRKSKVNSARAEDDLTDDDRFDFTSKQHKSSLAAPRSSQAYPGRLSPVPVIASPVSPYESYSPTDPPLRPQPVKPKSFQAYQAPPSISPYPSTQSPRHSKRSYTPVSTDESSDEADPSRPPSARIRRGHSSAGSAASETAPRHSKTVQESPSSPSYRFPPSDSEGELPLRRNESFSRTHPSSYPFTTDDEEGDSEPAPPRRQVKPSQSIPTRSYDKDDRFDSTIDDSEPESYRYGSSSTQRGREANNPSIYYESSTAPRSSAGGEAGRRTMVSKPLSNQSRVGPSRTEALNGSASLESYSSTFGNERAAREYPSRQEKVKPQEEYSSTFSRSTTVDPYYSPHLTSGYDPTFLSSSFTPSYEATPSSQTAQSHRRSSSPPQGFTGFDLRSQSSTSHNLHQSNVASSSRSRDSDGRILKEEKSKGRKGASRSSIAYGANQAPVGRRMAQRLGARE